MTSKNKYSKDAKFSEAKIRQIVRLFSIDLNISQIAEVTKLNSNTVNRYISVLKERIANFYKVEVVESYFGARQVKALR